MTKTSPCWTGWKKWPRRAAPRMAEVAIAWLRDRPSVVAPIASATSLEQMQSLIRGAALKLSPEEIAALG